MNLLLGLFVDHSTKQCRVPNDVFTWWLTPSALLSAQVIKCYPGETAGFAAHIMELLDTHFAQLDSSLRKSLVQVRRGAREGAEQGPGRLAKAVGQGVCKRLLSGRWYTMSG